MNRTQSRMFRTPSFWAVAAASIAAACMVTCTLRSPNAPRPTALTRCYAFVSRSLIAAPSLADTSALQTSIVLHRSEQASFYGLLDRPAAGLACRWDFGDGAASTQALDRHAYTTGKTYLAVFSITDSLGNSTRDTVSVTVLSYASLANLTASAGAVGQDDVLLSWSYASAEAGRQITADLYISDSPQFGSPVQTDIYATEARYTPPTATEKTYYWRIVTHDPTGAADTSATNSFIYRPGQVIPVSFSASALNADTAVTAGDSVTFRVNVTAQNCNLASLSWDYNADGTFDYTAASSSASGYRYLAAGVYRAALTAVSDRGDTARDTVTVSVLAGQSVFLAAIRNHDTLVTAQDSLVFEADVVAQNCVLVSAAWDFDGDGVADRQKASLAPEGWRFTATGLTRVVLTAVSSRGDTARDTVFVTVQSALQPRFAVAFRNVDTAVCAGDSVTFSAVLDLQARTLASVSWDLDGDGVADRQGVALAAVGYRYNQAGTYRAMVSAISTQADTARDTVVVTVNAVVFAVAIRNQDTTVATGDSVTFRADATTQNCTLAGVRWDLDGDGATDRQGAALTPVGYRYSRAGTYRVVVMAVSSRSDTALDSVRVTVQDASLPQIAFVSDDTIVAFGGVVRCSLRVAFESAVVVDIDTANTGAWRRLPAAGAGGTSYVFSTGTAASWDSVKFRVTDQNSRSVYAGFGVDIRPRTVAITRIDSTTNTITVNWGRSLETDFSEYRVYRDTSASVTMSSELWARRTTAAETSYTTAPPSYAWEPRYYRVFQKDGEGLWSEGGAAVRGVIRNTPTASPLFAFTYPTGDGVTIRLTDTLRWTAATDSNGAVRYMVIYRTTGTGNPWVLAARDLTSQFCAIPNAVPLSPATVDFRVYPYDASNDTTGLRATVRTITVRRF